MFECLFFLWKSPQIESESAESKGSSDIADAKAVAKAKAKVEADIEECKEEIKDMKSQISQLKTDISIKECQLNNAETKEEDKIEIRKQLTLLMTSKVQTETAKTQLETRLTNAMEHLNNLKEAALRPTEGNKNID